MVSNFELTIHFAGIILFIVVTISTTPRMIPIVVTYIGKFAQGAFRNFLMIPTIYTL